MPFWDHRASALSLLSRWVCLIFSLRGFCVLGLPWVAQRVGRLPALCPAQPPSCVSSGSCRLTQLAPARRQVSAPEGLAEAFLARGLSTVASPLRSHSPDTFEFDDWPFEATRGQFPPGTDPATICHTCVRMAGNFWALFLRIDRRLTNRGQQKGVAELTTKKKTGPRRPVGLVCRTERFLSRMRLHCCGLVLVTEIVTPKH